MNSWALGKYIYLLPGLPGDAAAADRGGQNHRGRVPRRPQQQRHD